MKETIVAGELFERERKRSVPGTISFGQGFLLLSHTLRSLTGYYHSPAGMAQAQMSVKKQQGGH